MTVHPAAPGPATVAAPVSAANGRWPPEGRIYTHTDRQTHRRPGGRTAMSGTGTAGAAVRGGGGRVTHCGNWSTRPGHTLGEDGKVGWVPGPVTHWAETRSWGGASTGQWEAHTRSGTATAGRFGHPPSHHGLSCHHVERHTNRPLFLQRLPSRQKL